MEKYIFYFLGKLVVKNTIDNWIIGAILEEMQEKNETYLKLPYVKVGKKATVY